MNLTNEKALPFCLESTDGELVTDHGYRGTWLLMVFLRHLG